MTRGQRYYRRHKQRELARNKAWKQANPEWNTWIDMHRRCYYYRRHNYKDYGGRGIKICLRWRKGTLNAYHNFLADMGRRPNGTSIDRINNNGHYMPSNCRWVSKLIQANNKHR